MKAIKYNNAFFVEVANSIYEIYNLNWEIIDLETLTKEEIKTLKENGEQINAPF